MFWLFSACFQLNSNRALDETALDTTIFYMRGEGGCAIGTYAAATDLLIAQFNRGTLKVIYGVDSMHDQRRCSSCFHRRKKRAGPRGGRREECWLS